MGALDGERKLRLYNRRKEPIDTAALLPGLQADRHRGLKRHNDVINALQEAMGSQFAGRKV